MSKIPWETISDLSLIQANFTFRSLFLDKSDYRGFNEIRPDAVPLVDSFGFLDSQLQSTLGRYDGNVYEAIYDEAANKNPLNNSKEGKGKMIGWDIYSKVLNLDFLNETEKKQYQARGGNVDNNNMNDNFAASRL